MDFDFGFDSRGTTTYMFRPTPTARGQLRALAARMQAAAPTHHDKLITRYQIEKDLEKIDPALTKIWRKVKGENAMALASYISLLLTLISFMTSCDNRDYSLDEVVEIVRELEESTPGPMKDRMPETSTPGQPIAPELLDPPETSDT